MTGTEKFDGRRDDDRSRHDAADRTVDDPATEAPAPPWLQRPEQSGDPFGGPPAVLGAPPPAEDGDGPAPLPAQGAPARDEDLGYGGAPAPEEDDIPPEYAPNLAPAYGGPGPEEDDLPAAAHHADPATVHDDAALPWYGVPPEYGAGPVPQYGRGSVAHHGGVPAGGAPGFGGEPGPGGSLASGAPGGHLAGAPPAPADYPGAAGYGRPSVPPAAPPPLIREQGSPMAPYEPWRLPAPRRQGPRQGSGKVIRRLFVTLAAVVVIAVAAVVTVVVLDVADDSTDVEGSRLAGEVFTGDPGATADGRDQELNGVAAGGSTVVAVGGETDHITQRAQFLVSTDTGRSYELAAVRTADGREPPPGDVPRHVANSPRGWAALGDRPGGTAVWTGRDGRAWNRQDDVAGEPFGPGTQLNRLIGTPSGFLAVGAVSRKGDFSDAAPALWISEDGRRWERRADDQLSLGAKGGTLSLVDAAAGGDTLLIQGMHTRKPGASDPDVRNMIWRSDDGGRSWSESKVRAPKGTAGLSIGGGATGFLAVREIKDGARTYGQAFTSQDGDSWTEAGKISARGQQRLVRLLVSGDAQVAVVEAAGRVVVMRGRSGAGWREAGSLPIVPGKTLLAAATAGGQTVLTGRDVTGRDVNAILAVRDQGGQEVRTDLTRVPGAVQEDQVVRGVAASGGRAVAIGGTNGDAAVWTSADGGAWRRASAEGEAFARPGLQRLADVVAGGSGWLAVGSDGVAPIRPLVVTSADGTTWRAAAGADVFQARPNVPLGTRAAAAGPAGYVIVGEDGPGPAAWFSADLKTWQRGTAAGRHDFGPGRWLRGATAGAFGFVAVGGWSDPSVKNAPNTRPGVWTSTDGRRWTARPLPLPAGLVEGSLEHVVARDRLLVATGNAGTPKGSRPLAYVSADGGATWQPTMLPADAHSVTARAALTPAGFLVAGTIGAPGTGDVVVWKSADGRTWTAVRPKGPGLDGDGEQELTGLTMVGDRLLAVGSTSDHRGKTPTLWRGRLP